MRNHLSRMLERLISWSVNNRFWVSLLAGWLVPGSGPQPRRAAAARHDGHGAGRPQ